MSDREKGEGRGESVATAGIHNCGYITTSVCLYWCMWVHMGSSVRNPAVKSHVLVQSGHDDCNAAGFGMG